MAIQAPSLQVLIDRAAIHDLHARYFQGLDRGDPGQVRSCFTDDVVAYYDGRSALRPGPQAPVRGISALMDSLVTFRNQQSGQWKITTHFMENLHISMLAGSVAETEINAIAFIVLPGEPHDEVAMRSLRYIDRLRRGADGWQICERVHTLDWSCAVPADYSVQQALRVTQSCQTE